MRPKNDAFKQRNKIRERLCPERTPAEMELLRQKKKNLTFLKKKNQAELSAEWRHRSARADAVSRGDD